MEKNRIKKNVAIFINCTLIALKSKAHKKQKVTELDSIFY